MKVILWCMFGVIILLVIPMEISIYTHNTPLVTATSYWIVLYFLYKPVSIIVNKFTEIKKKL